jgi:hypothetical protein
MQEMTQRGGHPRGELECLERSPVHSLHIPTEYSAQECPLIAAI